MSSMLTKCKVWKSVILIQYANNMWNLKQSVFPCWGECQDLSVHEVKNLVGNSQEYFMSQNSEHGSKVHLGV